MFNKLENDETTNTMKHFMHLDTISKEMMMLETLFGLALAFLGEYKDIPRKMMSYDQSKIDGLVKKLMKNALSTSEIWKIIGFPALNKLNLFPGEDQTILKVLDRSTNDLREYFHTLAQFYVEHKSTYNRFKHGFSIMAGMESSGDPNGLTLVFDKKTRLQGRFFRYTSDVMHYGFNWFNVVSLVPYSNQALNYHVEILDLIASAFQQLIRNHLAYAYNLGEDYFPEKLTTKGNIPEEDLKSVNAIVDRLRQNMHHIETPTFKMALNLKGEKLSKIRAQFAESQIATFFVLTIDDVKKSVEEYLRKQKIFDVNTGLTIISELNKWPENSSAEQVVKLIDYVQKSKQIDEEAREDLLLKLRSFLDEPFRTLDEKLDIEHKAGDTVSREELRWPNGDSE
jgi:hypothetical protein